MGEIINAYNVLVCKLEEKGPLGRRRRRRKDDIRTDLREIRRKFDWIHLSQDRDL
jgi:hypothetical protein